MATNATSKAPARWALSKGVSTVLIALVVLIVAGFVLAPSSVSIGAILGMLPFAAVLAIIGLGQMLVVQQGGIDLSVPGAMSLAVVIISHYPTGDDALLLPAFGIALMWAVGAGVLNAAMAASTSPPLASRMVAKGSPTPLPSLPPPSIMARACSSRGGAGVSVGTEAATTGCFDFGLPPPLLLDLEPPPPPVEDLEREDFF